MLIRSWTMNLQQYRIIDENKRVATAFSDSCKQKEIFSLLKIVKKVFIDIGQCLCLFLLSKLTLRLVLSSAQYEWNYYKTCERIADVFNGHIFDSIQSIFSKTRRIMSENFSTPFTENFHIILKDIKWYPYNTFPNIVKSIRQQTPYTQ